MEIFVLTVIAMGLLMLGMAVGVIFRRKPLKGSCGGVAADCYCEANNLPRACELKEAIKNARIPAECAKDE